MEEFLYNHFDELPALKFFWSDRVQPDDRRRFCKKLAQLYELFLTPHSLPVAPYKDLSYLKKYEMLHSEPRNYTRLPFHLTKMLSLDHWHIDMHFPLHTTIQVKSSFNAYRGGEPEVPDSFKQPFTQWFTKMKFKHIFTCPIQLHFGGSNYHSVFFAARRMVPENKIQILMLDPHGFNYGDKSLRNDHYRAKVRRVFREYIEATFNIPTKEYLFSCPELQYWEQGENCHQWYIYLFALFMTAPELVDNPREKLYQIGAHANVNIHLFELCMFLRTMPVFTLDDYYHVTRLQLHPNADQLEEDGDARDGDSKVLNMPDCYSRQYKRRCPAPCVRCGTTCNYPEAVILPGTTDCKPLRPRQIATRMFILYAAIRKMTGQDPRSMTASQIREQLSFEEAVTPEDFKRIYNKTDRDLEVRETRYRDMLKAQPKTWRDYLPF